MQIIDSFEQQIIGVARDGQIQISTGEEVPVYTIDSFHVLTQFVGYAKYINRQNANVYLRGQTGLYDGHLIPSIYRPLSGSGSVNYSERTPKYMEKVHQALSKSKAFDSIDSRAIVPLLQHYGIKTSWLDVVDNLWVALWFGLHKFHSIILQNHEYIHISEVNPNEYAYLFLIAVDAREELASCIKDKRVSFPGVYSGETTQLVDLRKAVPSYYLRPHAQHGLMIHKKRINHTHGRLLEKVDVDYSEFVVGVAKIPAALGFSWIGHTGLLSTQSLFPSAVYDNGYSKLIQYYQVDANSIPTYGSIQIISS